MAVTAAAIERPRIIFVQLQNWVHFGCAFGTGRPLCALYPVRPSTEFMTDGSANLVIIFVRQIGDIIWGFDCFSACVGAGVGLSCLHLLGTNNLLKRPIMNPSYPSCFLRNLQHIFARFRGDNTVELSRDEALACFI